MFLEKLLRFLIVLKYSDFKLELNNASYLNIIIIMEIVLILSFECFNLLDQCDILDMWLQF
jgi:hypothetical protein